MKLIRTPPEFPKGPEPIRAKPTPQGSDAILRTAKEAAASDRAKGTKPHGPKPYDEPATVSHDTVEPDSTGAPATPDIHSAISSAFHEVGTALLQSHNEPATMATIGFAFRHVADKLRTPEGGPSSPEGSSTGGLFSTPAPEQEAV
jgi:hypothetical protein